MGVFVADLPGFYSDLMKWDQTCEEPFLCFLASFDMIFTRICETQLRAADFSKTSCCLHFYISFLKNDKIGMFFGTMFLCDLGPFGGIPAMRRFEAALRAIW